MINAMLGTMVLSEITEVIHSSPSYSSDRSVERGNHRLRLREHVARQNAEINPLPARHPSDVLHKGQKVRVRVTSIDRKKDLVFLSMQL